ncbi:MAG: amidase [Bordetella sp.]|uniref:amidase n=1 Tax=Bordetella sp. TaxID=28081 RepID=UPI003F7BFC40
MVVETAAGLPGNIAGLRALIERKALTPDEALASQSEAFRKEPWHCAVAQMPRVPGRQSAGPLSGVGFAHKDLFRLANRVPECGAAHPWPAAPARAASAIVRLARAGSQPLAALAMAEHACGATAQNPRYPDVINPLDARAAVGGSSSGSAVAVAAGLCYGSLGTDTAGSIRIPAATCGVFGLKPTQGAVPVDGVAPLAPSLDSVGLLARGADDALYLWRALQSARFSNDRPVSRDAGVPATDDAWKVATCWIHGDPGMSATDSATQCALDEFADACSSRGRRRDVLLHDMPHWMRLAQTLLYAEAASTHTLALRGAQPALGPLARAIALPGVALPASWYLQAQEERALHTRRFVADILADVHLLLVPALPTGVPDKDEVSTVSPHFRPRRLLDLFCWMSFVNYLGLPAAVFPIAYDRNARPICVQAIARPGDEATLLAFARQVELRRFDGQGFTRLPAHQPI